MTQYQMTQRQLDRPSFSATPPTHSRSSAWSAEDLLRWLAVLVIGISMVVAAGLLASSRASVGHQVPPVDLAIAGAVVIVSGNGMWLVRARRRIGQRIRAVSTHARLFVHATRLPADAPTQNSAGEYSFVPGLRYFHQVDCHLLKERLCDSAPRDEHELAGRNPCPICRP
jgi:hypothetical protein